MNNSKLLLVLLALLINKVTWADPLSPALVNCAKIEGKETEKDSLSIKAIPYPLSWVNRGDQYELLSDNSLSITARGGTDLYNFAGGGPNKTNAPILGFQADENFVLTSQVKVGFEKPYDGGSLVLFEDSLHYAKLMFEKGHDGKIVISTGVTNTFTDDNINTELITEEVSLRIAKAGDLCIFYYSIDGQTWKLLRIFKFENQGNLKLGFSSQSPEGESCRTVFSNISYSPQPFNDFWTGN